MITQEEFNSFINSYQTFERAVERVEKAIAGKGHY